MSVASDGEHQMRLQRSASGDVTSEVECCPCSTGTHHRPHKLLRCNTQQRDDSALTLSHDNVLQRMHHSTTIRGFCQSCRFFIQRRWNEVSDSDCISRSVRLGLAWHHCFQLLYRKQSNLVCVCLKVKLLARKLPRFVFLVYARKSVPEGRALVFVEGANGYVVRTDIWNKFLLFH